MAHINSAHNLHLHEALKKRLIGNLKENTKTLKTGNQHLDSTLYMDSKL